MISSQVVGWAEFHLALSDDNVFCVGVTNQVIVVFQSCLLLMLRVFSHNFPCVYISSPLLNHWIFGFQDIDFWLTSSLAPAQAQVGRLARQ